MRTWIKILNLIHIGAMGIPVIIAVNCVRQHSFVAGVLAVICMFLLIALLPAARHRESIWMFVMTSITYIPINLWFIKGITDWFSDVSVPGIGSILWSILLYCILFGLEQICMGIPTRLIWRKQYKTEFSK